MVFLWVIRHQMVFLMTIFGIFGFKGVFLIKICHFLRVFGQNLLSSRVGRKKSEFSVRNCVLVCCMVAQCNRHEVRQETAISHSTRLLGFRNLLSSRVGRKKSEFSGAPLYCLLVFFWRNAIDTRSDKQKAPWEVDFDVFLVIFCSLLRAILVIFDVFLVKICCHLGMVSRKVSFSSAVLYIE